MFIQLKKNASSWNGIFASKREVQELYLKNLEALVLFIINTD